MSDVKEYRLESSNLVNTPGVLRYAQRMFQSGDEELAVRMFVEGFEGLDEDTAYGLVSDTIPYEIKKRTVHVKEAGTHETS